MRFDGVRTPVDQQVGAIPHLAECARGVSQNGGGGLNRIVQSGRPSIDEDSDVAVSVMTEKPLAAQRASAFGADDPSVFDVQVDVVAEATADVQVALVTMVRSMFGARVPLLSLSDERCTLVSLHERRNPYRRDS